MQASSMHAASGPEPDSETGLRGVHTDGRGPASRKQAILARYNRQPLTLSTPHLVHEGIQGYAKQPARHRQPGHQVAAVPADEARPPKSCSRPPQVEVGAQKGPCTCWVSAADMLQ